MINEERITFLMKKLKISREEALELEGYDDDVNHDRKTEYDLTPEQIAVVQEMNRKKEHKKYGTVHRERKPNEIKESIISAIAFFLADECELLVKDQFMSCDSVEITNKNRMIHFKVKDKEYDLQLIEKREKKNKEK